jgi:hypothetical protein
MPVSLTSFAENQAFLDALKDLLLGPIVIHCLTIILGTLLIAYALKNERGKTRQTVLLAIGFSLELSLFSIFSSNFLQGLVNVGLTYVASSSLFLFYGFMQSKQLYEMMIQNQMIVVGRYHILFWFSAACMILGQIISIVFFVDVTKNQALGGAGQFLIFIGFCCWIHFLNVLRKVENSSKIAKRMFWAALGVVLFAILALAVAIIFSIVLANSDSIKNELHEKSALHT